jgi:hypothetical protein
MSACLFTDICYVALHLLISFLSGSRATRLQSLITIIILASHITSYTAVEGFQSRLSAQISLTGSYEMMPTISPTALHCNPSSTSTSRGLEASILYVVYHITSVFLNLYERHHSYTTILLSSFIFYLLSYALWETETELVRKDKEEEV